MKPIGLFGLPIGISMLFWSIMGIARLISEKINFPKPKVSNERITSSDIAVIIPAHDEELVIGKCVQALGKILPTKQIYVCSDGSTDNTFLEAQKYKVNVTELQPGRGKAKAMIHLLEEFNLYERYKLIFIVDADTQIDKNFLKKALALLKDPDISVVFGSARIKWPDHIIPKLSYYYFSYRERLNRMLQYFMMYGQTWKYTNASYVIPGFATIYRSKILKQLEIDTPGLLIEDFNLAFQLHKKKLGKIGYDPGMIGWDQHPDNLKDYWKQVKRWNIGFFQTVRKNGAWPSLFWLSLIIFTIEVFLNSIFVLCVPVIIFFLTLPYLEIYIPTLHNLNLIYQSPIFQQVTFADLYIQFVLVDYLTTIIIGWINRKPQFVFYGIFFIYMHLVTSLILASSLIPGLTKDSDGRWISPRRQKIE